MVKMLASVTFILHDVELGCIKIFHFGVKRWTV